MVGHLPEPGTNNDDYQTLKSKLKEAYTKTDMERCGEMMSIVSLGDRNPEHLLNFMKGLLPGEDKSKLFKYIWLNTLPENVHQALAADEGDLGVLAIKATKMMREKAARRRRAEQVNAMKESKEAQLEINAVAGGISKVKAGVVCTNHLRFPGNCYRCFDPECCLLKGAVIPRPASSGNPRKKAGNARAGRQ